MGICLGTFADTSIGPSSPGQLTPATNSVSTTGSARNSFIISSETLGDAFPSGQVLPAPNLKVFTFGELRSATRNFKPDTLLGEGGFGKVYKAWVDEKNLTPTKTGLGIIVAVKKLNPESVQGLEEWKSEVDFLGRLSHPNLVKLFGYCWEDRELLLVYEFMHKGNLENHLFRRGANYQPLSWNLRLRIAMGAARGLVFLHESKIIYRDFKASNILLDLDYNAKLSDFGLARNGPTGGNSHVSTRVLGTYAYVAPEYVATGHLYVKSDVYGFGVVLLEILSGLRAYDMNRPKGQQNLVDWAKPLLSDRRKLSRLMDVSFACQYPPKAALKVAKLALRCLSSNPKHRPSMEEVLGNLEEIMAVKEETQEAKSVSVQPRARGQVPTPAHARHHACTRPSSTVG